MILLTIDNWHATTGPEVCETVYEENCEKVPHEECKVIQEEVCDAPVYQPTYNNPGYGPYKHKPRCRNVDRRVCDNIYIDKCVKTPTQKCSPGPTVRFVRFWNFTEYSFRFPNI